MKHKNLKQNNLLNKIGIIGTQCTGKSTLVADIKSRWPMFETLPTSYRDVIKKNKLPLNKQATKDSQDMILNYLVDEAMYNYGKKKVVFDRTVIDNLVYSLWLYEKKKGDIDEKYIDKIVPIIRNAVKFYSVIFYLPFCKENDVPVTEAPNREIDQVYRSEVGHIFEALYRAWESQKSQFFDSEDTPAIIPIFGSREERLAMISLYINEKGNMYGEDESLLANPFDEELLKKQFGDLKNK